MEHTDRSRASTSKGRRAGSTPPSCYPGQLFPDKASREAVECRDAARILDVDPRLFRRLNNNALDADGRITQLSGWLVAPDQLKAPCALCRCRGEIRAWRCRVERRHATPPYNDPEAQKDGMRVKVRCTEGDSAKWKAALLIGDATQGECKVQFVGTDTLESVEKDRLCFLGAAPFRTPTAKEKACAGRSVEVHLGGQRRAGSREARLRERRRGPGPRRDALRVD